MGNKFVCLGVVLFMILASLTLNLVAILTDHWYNVQADSLGNSTFQSKWTYHYGIWKKCYESLPSDTPVVKERVGSNGNCIFIYEDMIQSHEDTLPYDDQLYLHLTRCFVAFAILCGGIQLFTILTLICGVWPADCHNIKRSKIYLGAALMLLLATICGSVSGICFIALRDLDVDPQNLYPQGVASNYDWSFMIHWISTGMCIVESCILLCLLKESYDDVAEKFSYYNIY
ncbi:hypothetical protein LOTGIDRAFT_235099 [Lottia gigantea]|uniref:Claudin n=1 Tax=Lottia gigantea TaxID=225164 RepID=V3ZSV8_LOTGI|nr:hypothetical protein LOTGIDRAFT_235099 [Lottia gigantea]ESO87432.1 hypothetical protein LOTGIDRAFT_235099 [Lottia gigantea]